MTYLESYMSLTTVEQIKNKVKEDVKVAIFLGNNPDRIKAIEDAMNDAISMMEVEHETD